MLDGEPGNLNGGLVKARAELFPCFCIGEITLQSRNLLSIRSRSQHESDSSPVCTVQRDIKHRSWYKSNVI